MSTKPSPEQPIENPEKWREDFPVDIPQDQFVSRREFIKFLLLISGIFAAGQLGMGLLTKLQTSKKNSALINASIPIASTSELAVGESKIFHYPKEGDTNLLIRVRDEEWLAYSNKCTHLMCPVIPKVDEGKIYCPCHEGYFSLATGRPMAGPPPRPLRGIALKIKNDTIYAVGFKGPSA